MLSRQDNRVSILIDAAITGREKVQQYQHLGNSRYKSDGSLITDADIASEDVITEFLKHVWPDVPILSEEDGKTDIDITHGDWFIVDPLDGTTNFSRNIRLSSVSIAYVVNGEPQAGIVMPIYDEHYYVAVKNKGSEIVNIKDGSNKSLKCINRPLEKSILSITCDQNNDESRKQWWKWMQILKPPVCFRLRIVESAALELCWLAEGKIDGYMHPSDKPWDVAAAELIIREAGATVYGINLDTWSLANNGILAFNPSVADAVLSLIRNTE